LAIEVSDLRYSYPGADRPALDGITFRIEQGELVGVVGANGSGKSTLCYALAGFLPALYQGTAEGTVRVMGLDPVRSGPSAMAGTIGLVLQDPFSQISGARLTVEEEVAFGLENLGVPRAEMAPRVGRALRLAGLGSLAGRSPFELSGGEQQRLALASIFAMEPKVLLLDEPISHLDPVGAREVITAVDQLTAERGTTVLLVEQRLEWMAAHADRALVLEAGRLVEDGPAHRVLTSRSLEARGVLRTRYASAAELAAARRLIARPRRVPATLEEAVGAFR
jgi:energy-coupling factor transporter ATP-binding protein EcfA2